MLRAVLRDRVHAFGQALSKQPHLMAIRDGVVGSLPLILLGSLFLLLGQPPWPALSRILPPASTLLMGYRLLAGLIALYVCVATALSLARRREVDVVAGATTSLAVFLVAQHPAGGALPLATLGAAGLFPSFAAAIFAVEILAWFKRREWGIKLTGGVPDAVVRSFAALLPTIACVVTIWLVVHVLGIDLVDGIAMIFRPLLRGSDSLAAVLLVVLIDSALWMIGVHGLAILAAVRPFWLQALAENMAAVSAGQPPAHIFTQEFFIWFIWQGGSGTALALALLLLFARSKPLRVIGETGIVPAIFNINEPLLFGLPVVMNGKLAVPFIASPVVLGVTSWLAVHFGLVRAPYLEVVWTLPAPIGAYLSTGGDPRALVLQMVNLAIALALWWPFLRRYDRALAKAPAEPQPA